MILNRRPQSAQSRGFIFWVGKSNFLFFTGEEELGFCVWGMRMKILLLDLQNVGSLFSLSPVRKNISLVLCALCGLLFEN